MGSETSATTGDCWSVSTWKVPSDGISGMMRYCSLQSVAVHLYIIAKLDMILSAKDDNMSYVPMYRNALETHRTIW